MHSARRSPIMRCDLFSFMKRRAARGLAAGLLGAGGLLSAGQALAATPAPFVAEALGGATLAGKGQLRFLGLHVYGARLWVGPGFQAADFEAHPFALELTYRRAFTGAAIVERSIQEMQRQTPIAAPQAERWRQQLAAVMPDVKSGDRLIGLYQPGQGMRLWRGSQLLGVIDDAELARLFFGIWLSPRTSDPGLRSALLAREGGGAP